MKHAATAATSPKSPSAGAFVVFAAPQGVRRLPALSKFHPFLLRRLSWTLFGILLLASLLPREWWHPALSSGSSASPGTSLRVLMVGGGPDEDNNQVAIESNVRYVGRLLPQGTPRITLFADGNARQATVLYDYAPASGPNSPGQRLLDLLLEEGAGYPNARFRVPNLGAPLDGPSSRAAIDKAFDRLSREVTAGQNVLLFFTGHGSSDERRNENNVYDLWDEETLSVRDLAHHLARLPAQTPVALVMVQCYSGSFGNLLFENGDPQGAPLDRDLAGFFATTKDRTAAGCTSAVDEAEYHDFTSYFFAALTGRDRVGRRVEGADFDGNGRVGMNEAFYYTLAHDKSIDVPVCTSDVFVRRFAPLADDKVFATPYNELRGWADAAQRAALDQLSLQLDLAGENRLSVAQRRLGGQGLSAAAVRLRKLAEAYDSGAALQRFEAARTTGRRKLFARFPLLRNSRASDFKAARLRAIASLTAQIKAGEWQEVLAAAQALNRGATASETQEIAQSTLLRFVRLGKSVVLAHHLRQSGTAAIKARFERLLVSEGRALLPRAAVP